MTTVRPEPTGSVADDARSLATSARRRLDPVRQLLDRPLTSYYLLLVAPALLLTIGLMMVLSASSVEAYKYHDDSYYWVRRQLVAVAVGLPLVWLASRLPLRWLRALAWPGLLLASACSC